MNAARHRRLELQINDGRRFAVAINAADEIVSVHRILGRPVLINGQWTEQFDEYRSVSAKHKSRPAIEAAIRLALVRNPPAAL